MKRFIEYDHERRGYIIDLPEPVYDVAVKTIDLWLKVWPEAVICKAALFLWLFTEWAR
jgi:hypothetical protein